MKRGFGSSHGFAASALPREPTRGLIEASCEPGGRTRNCPLPREPTRGLIEASRSAARALGKRGLPREPTRGLIEAGRCPEAGWTCRSHFPENQLGASLKRAPGAPDDLGRRHFPENQLGASLKLVAAVPMPGMAVDFPENQLGASLKRHVPVQDHRSRSHFPENQLGASLKPFSFALISSSPVLLPREPTRGLIEARRGRGTPAPPWRLPREPTRGLIEARPALQDHPPDGQHFPENQLGASLKRDAPPRAPSRPS